MWVVCVVCSVVSVSDGCGAAKCQHGTQSERLQQQKGCNSRLQIRFARFGPLFGQARARQSRSGRAAAQACTVSTRSGALCVWVVCVLCGVVSVSDWCWAAKCQHGTQSERLQQQKGCNSRLQIRFARLGPLFGQARARQCGPARQGPKRVRCRLGLERCVWVVLCCMQCGDLFRWVLGCQMSAWDPK